MSCPTINCVILAILLPISALIGGANSVDNTGSVSQLQGDSFNIDDTKCRVGIASVKLSIGELISEDGNLVGEYTIVVPLIGSKNDRGRIVLPLNGNTVSEIGANGGTFKGKAFSYKEGKTPNNIVCHVLPLKDQKILLRITTDDRTLNFESNYSISETASGS